MDPRGGKEDSLLKLQKISFQRNYYNPSRIAISLRNKKEIHAGSWEYIEFRMADVKWPLQDIE